MYCYHKHHRDTYFVQACGEYRIDARISKAPCYENTEAIKSTQYKLKNINIRFIVPMKIAKSIPIKLLFLNFIQSPNLQC